ncbi:protein-glutamate methylesterase/protein-glutamine glutaminase [Afifella marina]|uniref:Protein-glutamate methylesterase/protein-glutamine glutaminase n=1 Tax=Afifella marina DSM 2698 TaxID=1120955 RepID=A0A1G5MV65_AFIMA|nr:two-component system, chemotaxis family, response regulator CheB [Afifella marina DSM 2698]
MNAIAAPPPGTRPAAARPKSDEPIRVMVVDDSAFIRGILARWISEEPDLALVASHPNGRRAVDDVIRSQPDVAILDIEMPEMDGLQALPLILEKRPGTAVIMASTLTRRGAEVSIRALTLGAADYVPKPDSANGLLAAADFRHDLISKVRSLGAGVRRGKSFRTPAPTTARQAPGASAPAATRGAAIPAAAKPKVRLRPASMSAVRALAIGSSTGGPQALTRFFTDAGSALTTIPVFVTQHMPPTFTTILAEHIAKASGRPAAEGVDGEPVRPGHIYVAPGGKHMLVAKSNGTTVIKLSDAPPVNFCKPAVDPMFQSISDVYGSATLALVLTGMGSDGAKGATIIADGGGAVIAQDEASSVVWGMPGATAEVGACSEILPIAEIGPRVVRRISGGRS